MSPGGVRFICTDRKSHRRWFFDDAVNSPDVQTIVTEASQEKETIAHQARYLQRAYPEGHRYRARLMCMKCGRTYEFAHGQLREYAARAAAESVTVVDLSFL